MSQRRLAPLACLAIAMLVIALPVTAHLLHAPSEQTVATWSPQDVPAGGATPGGTPDGTSGGGPTADPGPPGAVAPGPSPRGWPFPPVPPRTPPSSTPTPTGPAPGSSPTGGSAPADPTLLPAHAVPFGAFLGSPLSTARLTQFSAWLNQADVQVGHTYLPGDRWSDIEGSISLLAPWAAWRVAQPDRMLVLGVPMQQENEDDLSDSAVRSLLVQGAAGQFDTHFLTLARRLVALGATDTVITLGWEMNGSTYSSRCHPDPTDWRSYWRRIVTTMRSVPGQQFRFDFDPTRGADDNPWTECYPGDDVTDVIGMDSYDLDPGKSFQDYVTQPYGLQQQVDFAAAHHKPVSYPEWGMFRYGDDPAYVRQMLDWIGTHDTLYQTITDYCPHGVWGCQENPQAAAVYRKLMSAVPRPTPPAGASAGPSPSPSPSVSASPSSTAPVTAAPSTGTTPSPTPTPAAPPSLSPSAPAPASPSPTASPTPCHRRRSLADCRSVAPAPLPPVTTAPGGAAQSLVPARVKLPGKS